MNPFSYPKIKHARVYTPKQYKRYRTYKRILRLEFKGLCVYCRLPMTMKGNEGFGVDHYRPEKKFPHLVCTYSNLFYCCNTCNSHKNQYWPATAAKELTDFIPNPCDHVMFDHLRFVGAKITPRSRPGTMAEEFLDLNDPDSISFRNFIIDTIDTYSEKQSTLLKLKNEQTKRAKRSSNAAAIAAMAVAEIDAALIVVERNLKRLSGQL